MNRVVASFHSRSRRFIDVSSFSPIENASRENLETALNPLLTSYLLAAFASRRNAQGDPSRFARRLVAGRRHGLVTRYRDFWSIAETLMILRSVAAAQLNLQRGLQPTTGFAYLTEAR